MKRDKLLKKTYNARIDRLLWTKILEYCIENIVSISDLINDSVYEKLKLNRAKMLQEERQIRDEMEKDWNVWRQICGKNSDLKKEYDRVIKNNRYKQKSKLALDKVLEQYSIDDLIELKKQKETS